MITTFLRFTDEKQGSGWAWLVFNKESGYLEIKMTQNHDMI